MSGHRYDDRLSEIDDRTVTDAEADLDRLLSIEPSPGLVAKVRARIDSQRASSSRWFTAWRLGLAAASLVIAGILVTLAVRRGASEIPSRAPAVATAQPTPSVPARAVLTPTPVRAPDVVAANPAVSQRSHRPLNGQRTADSGQRTAKEPEVLVPPDQRIALQRALALSATGALDERMFAAQPLPAAASGDAPRVPPLVVDDVVVPPITAVGGGTEK